MQFGHHAPDVGTLGDAVAVATVCAGDEVIRPQGCHRPDRDRLLADAEVGGVRQVALARGAQQLILELPDGHELAVQVPEFCRAKWC